MILTDVYCSKILLVHIRVRLMYMHQILLKVFVQTLSKWKC